MPKLGYKDKVMALIKPVNGIAPVIAPDVFIAETAAVLGDVHLAEGVSIWFNAVLRGDVGPIRIGARSNLQDLVMVHCTSDYSETLVGEDVTVGHRAILHGCTVGDRCLIGMGAVILDLAVIEPDVIVAASAVVLENSRLESGFLYAGIPARKIKPLSAEQLQSLKTGAAHYVEVREWYRE